ncbi:hypothetical protein GJAV_G00072910 [Gymnothorax javanicus]|nr:hypothetical protein GJAV_G00072910 [Gymnothorax javanicus]
MNKLLVKDRPMLLPNTFKTLLIPSALFQLRIQSVASAKYVKNITTEVCHSLTKTPPTLDLSFTPPLLPVFPVTPQHCLCRKPPAAHAP